MNARFDLTIIDRRARQHGVDLGDLWSTIRVADPRPIDSILDKYRRSYPYGHDAETAKVAGIPSTRTLAGLCGVYGVELGQAHDAAADALAAARILYVMASRGEVKRKRWDAEGYWAKARWAEARGDLDALHALQCEYVEQDRPRFAEYKRRQAVELDAVGDTEGSAAAAAMADRIAAEVGWPVLEVMAHERPEWHPDRTSDVIA
jgi:DNA polymerase III epsilon subunit-like protein